MNRNGSISKNPDIVSIPISDADALSTDHIRLFQKTVLDFYRNHGRDFPWRKTNDPYCILVSEMMLQQTQASRVVNKYREFINTLPTFKALSEASLQEVLTRWQGLGYNRRAIALHRIGGIVTREHHGTLPRDPSVLETFPMIGCATARSIVAFAYNIPVVFVETNIRTVLVTTFFSGDTGDNSLQTLPTPSSADRTLIKLAERTLLRSDPRLWYNALMDYGAYIKKTIPRNGKTPGRNPPQPPFKNSNRQIRGQILKGLLREGELERRTLNDMLEFEPNRIQKAVDQLISEGFIDKNGDILSIRR